ncbi:MAG: polysaccharide pyruvyl transferase family protein [Catonella sp.]|uniref:polysaccharide pyruvyl transferase family protein n=1 Tax=Catonella sp. TaxID=2382125 RepID=UPI003FA0F603
MKKILVRTGLSPIEETPVSNILAYNLIGNNVGNLVYAYSVYRGLMTEPDIEFVPTKYRVLRLDVDRINDECDSFVIPLADFIRHDRVDEIKNMTKIINKLKIPCIIVGIGVRGEYDYENKGIKFKDDEIAYKFFKAVLNKSAMIGVRGEITGDYLKKLGFIPEKDYTVIGCPSFYTYGADLKLKTAKLNENSKMAFNNTVMAENNVQEFLLRESERFHDSYYYPQKIEELRTLYLGTKYRFNRKISGYPNTIENSIYMKDKVRFHTHYCSWKNDLAERDFSIGPRLHGNVMAILSGIPAVWITHDARMRELVDYHKLPQINAAEINENTDIFEIFAKADYKSFLEVHKENFKHYVDFLDKNGISHIFKDYKNPELNPLDKMLMERGIYSKDFSVKSVLKCDIEEISKRIDSYDLCLRTRRKEDLVVEQDIKKGLRNEIRELKDNNKAIEKELNAIVKKLQKTEEKLSKKDAELKEAKKTFTFLVRRKVKKVLGIIKKEENNSGHKC